MIAAKSVRVSEHLIAISPHTTGCNALACERLREICTILGNDALTADALADRLSFNRSSMLQLVLNQGVRTGILKRTTRYGQGLSNIRAADLWSVDREGLREIAGRPLQQRPSLFDQLAPRRQKLIARADWRATEFQSAGIRDEHNWWRAAALLAAIGDARKVTYAELETELKAGSTALQKAVKRLIKLGLLVVRASRGITKSDFRVVWGAFETLPQRSRREAKLPEPHSSFARYDAIPARQITATVLQRQILDTIELRFRDFGLPNLRVAQRFKLLAATIGEFIEATDKDLSIETGISAPLVAAVRKAAVAAGILRFEAGRGMKPGQWRLDWSDLATRCDDGQRRSKRRRRERQSKEKTVTVEAPVLAKSDAALNIEAVEPPALPKWDADRGELQVGTNSRPIAKQARRIRQVLEIFEKLGWPESIDSPFILDPRSHSDTIYALNRIKLLRFSSSKSGTSIAWKLENFE